MTDILDILTGGAAGGPRPEASAGLLSRLNRQHGRRLHTADRVEMGRILALPIEEPMTDEQFEEYCYANLLATAYESGFRFFRPQAELILAYERHEGVIGSVGVGWGKTLALLVMAQKAYERGRQKTILLVPPDTYDQVTLSQIPWARRKVPLSVPFHLLGHRNAHGRGRIAGSDRRGCYIMPYSLLSTSDAEELLGLIDPDCIFADEAHKLKNLDNAARTQRFFRYVRHRKPQLAFLSGTLTSRGVEDYHHMLTWALREESPLPLSPVVAAGWGSVLNSGSCPSDAQAGELQPLVGWARENFPRENFLAGVEGFRQAYNLRLVTAPGVVTTGQEEIKTSLAFANEEVPLPDAPEAVRLRELWSEVQDQYLTPSGDEIQHEMHVHKWLSELSAGFYNNLVWPPPEEWARRRGTTLEAAHDALSRAMEHHEAHQVYSRLLRRWLKTQGRPGLDTPGLVGTSLKHHGAEHVGDGALYEAWREAKGLEFDGMPERDSIAVRVCDYKLRATGEWVGRLPKKEGAVIWYYHREVGRWLMDLLATSSRARDLLWCPAEADSPGINATMARMTEDPAAHRKAVLVASLAHREGKNLQFLRHTHVVQWPRDAKAAEQMVGRLHRNGQEADHLEVHTCLSNDHDHLSFAATLNDAIYIQQTLGARQKLVYADYHPLPKVFHPALLRERGLQPKDLTQEQQQMLTERFGDWS